MNAECRMQNDFTTLRFAHKENYMDAERRMQNAERLCSAKSYANKERMISAERGARSTERLHSANAPLTRKIKFLSV